MGDPSQQKQKTPKKRRRGLRAGLYMVLGVALAFPLFSLTYYTMVRTSTPEFCAMCHEIQPAVRDWRSSSHVVNTRGFVADCMDCHLPAPHDTMDFFFQKTLHGIKDIVIHISGGQYDRKAMRERAWATMDNDQCMKCHRNLLYMPYKRGAMLAHRTVIFARPGQEKRCTDCHRNLVHRPRATFTYRTRDI